MKRKGKRPGIQLVVTAAVAFYALSFLAWPLPDASENQCQAETTPIRAIQGKDTVTPLDGERVLVRAVVTADFTDGDGLGGFFIQDVNSGAPERGEASRGLFVYAPDMEVRPGERLLISGEAGEYHGMTQISDVRLKARCGDGEAVAPVPVTLPLDEAQRHALQGMKVRLEPPLTVTGLYELDRYGVVAVADERLYQPTQVRKPGARAERVEDSNRRRKLLIDDGSTSRNPRLPGWVADAFSDRGSFRVGHRLSAVEGVLDYRYGEWRLQPLTPPSVAAAHSRPDPLERPPGNSVRFASFNLQNYFNGDGAGGGFPTERGARDHEDFERQHQKLVAALSALAPDVVGVVEVENDGYGSDSALAQLTGSLEGEWDYVRPDWRRLGNDRVTVGLIYRRGRIRPEGPALRLDSGAFGRLNRPSLAQKFRHEASGERLWVIVNHFKSKHCGDASGANEASGDGQGCWNPVRTKASERLAEWAGELQGGNGHEVLLLGDLNAYAREDPVRRLEEAGFRNVLDSHHPLPASGYVYRAESGTLDYILSTEGLNPLIQGAGVYSINADEPPFLYYDWENGHAVPDVAVPGENPWRSSDHDPTWVDVDFGVSDDD